MEAQAMYPFLSLHTLGWKAFQDLVAQICEVEFDTTVSIYREAQDGGEDATFICQQQNAKLNATVQCKFTSNSTKTLKISDIKPELPKIENLLKQGHAQKYIFITNMSVDAPIALEIENLIKNKGVVEVQVHGKEWLTKKIISSSKLRSLVPRVYGLGDLSLILDQRKLEQTKRILENASNTFKTYVSTEAHVKAVNVLHEHGIVLLLGAPMAGKSKIAEVYQWRDSITLNIDVLN